MKLHNIILLIMILCQSFITAADNLSDTKNQKILDNCIIPSDKYSLNTSWFIWEPYQFIKLNTQLGGYSVTGIDIEILKTIAAKVGVQLNYTRLNVKDSEARLISGEVNLTTGRTYSDTRANYVYYSEPYRYEENSIFILKNSSWSLNFENINEILAQIRLQNFRLGVGAGFIYADDQINDFITDQTNNDIIFQYESEALMVDALLQGQIDGFIGDNISSAATILNKRVMNIIDVFSLNIKTPIYLIFSKQTTPIALVNSFNQEIKTFIASAEYKNIIKAYIYPLLIIHTCYSKWFHIISVIGTIAFTLSGLAIGAKENYTFLGTLLLALVPSVLCGVLGDAILTPKNTEVIFNPTYLYYNLVIALFGFTAIRLLNYYNKASAEDRLLQKFWSNVMIFGDALGSACFIATGIAIVIMYKIEPIELWGPFFAFLISHGGIIIRDLLRNTAHVIYLSSNEINFEITILWSFIFSMFLGMHAASPNPETIKIAIITVTICCFLSRVFAHYFKISNIRFKPLE